MRLINRFLIGLSMLLLMIVSVNSATITLTTCGGVTSNNNYLINLTNPIITSGSSCFTSGAITNSNFTQLNDEIIIQNTGTYSFFSATTIRFNTYNNLSITFTNRGGDKAIFSPTGVIDAFYDNTFNNSVFKGGDWLRLFSYTGGSDVFNNNNNLFYETLITDFDYLIKANGGFPRTAQIKSWKFYDSALFLNLGYASANNWIDVRFNTYSNSVTNNIGIIGGAPTGGNSYIKSIIKGITDIDVNDDNVGDTNINAMMTLTLFIRDKVYNFYQDIKEGSDIIVISGANNFYINDEIINPNDNLILNNDNDFTHSFLNNNIFATGRNNLDLGKGINCNLLTSANCILGDTNNVLGQITLGDYKPFFIVKSNSQIIGVDFKKFWADTNNQLLGIDFLTQRNNILFKDNVFEKFDEISKTGTSESSHLVKLFGNNITFTNNIFNVFSINVNTIYELLDIKGTNTKNNQINNNIFDNQIAGSLNPSEIFTLNAVTEFYNNNLTGNIVITNNAGLSSQIDVTPLKGFLHTDGKIYFYNVGNFYTQNTGCVDVGFDGFCDSPYTTGVLTDTNPLSVYPFDFTQHLFTRLFVVDTLGFNITLTTPTNNQIIDIATDTTGVPFTFEHDSQFQDLVCSFVIDGFTESFVTNTPTNTPQTINAIAGTTWTTGTHNFQVECKNEFNTINSQLNTFTITIAGVGGGNGNGGGGNNQTTTTTENPVADLGTDILSFDSETGIQDTNANALGFIADIGSFIVSIGVPLAILISIILVVLAGLRLLF